MNVGANDILDKDIRSRIDRVVINSTEKQSELPKLSMLREDEIHVDISGNKWRKLKYNMQKANHLKYKMVLTFGGAFSNHIAATAAAGREYGIQTIGLIRGEERLPLNPTLARATSDGMRIEYISRSDYRMKEDYDYIDSLRIRYGRFLLIPEGGTNYLGINGCMEILNEETDDYDLIVVPVGTGGTLTGIALSIKEEQSILGFSALKGVDYEPFMKNGIANFLQNEEEKNQILSRITILQDVQFGGYAKINKELMDFIREFKEEQHILLDPVYTAKMMFGLIQMIEKGLLSNYKNILAIHTGGLQGLTGFQHRGIIDGLTYLGKPLS